MVPLTFADALRLPVFRRADPVVLTGPEGLQRPVRWVHATELLELAGLLRAGDLVLTMGTGMPSEDDVTGLENYARTLADVESAGLVVELGRRWHGAIPEPVITAFRACGVPLVALRHEASFARMAQAVGERIVSRQLADLRDAQRVHDAFTELSFTQAGPPEILAAVQRLAGATVVLEDAQHRLLDHLAGPEDTVAFLDEWQMRSSRVAPSGRTAWDPANGWLVTRLGENGQAWGRLVIGSASPPEQRLFVVADRAAAALTLHRRHDRGRRSSVRRNHRELIEALRTDPGSSELLRRCQTAGFPVGQRHFVAMTARPSGEPSSVAREEIGVTAVRAAHSLDVPALVCEADRDVRLLLSLRPCRDDASVADRLGAQLLAQHPVIVTAGSLVTDRRGIERTLLEATQVADAVPQASSAAGQTRSVHRMEDLHLRGLLTLFGDDERLRVFVDRELGPLRDGTHRDRGDLYATLRALLHYPASKTDAAASLHLSRTAFYDRVAKIEQTLDVDLSDPDVRASLHVALLADELTHTRARLRVRTQETARARARTPSSSRST